MGLINAEIPSQSHNKLKLIESGEMYNNAFEWRFEFPEVLDEEGNFIGFDVVIGNPPYLPLEYYTDVEKKFFSNPELCHCVKVG